MNNKEFNIPMQNIFFQQDHDGHSHNSWNKKFTFLEDSEITVK